MTCIAVYCNFNIMSPSEVIIEVYIMPEDASFGAFFLSVLRLFSFNYKGKKCLHLSHCDSRPGWAPWLHHAVPTKPRDPGGSKRDLEGAALNSKCAICVPRCGWAVLPALFSFPPSLLFRAWPQRPPFSYSLALHLDEGII